MVSLQPAYVLHSRPFRETSMLVEFFLPEGRISCLARGVKKPKHSDSGLLQPFSPLFIEYGGKSELKKLFKVESRERPLRFHQNKLFSALYINEVIVRLLDKGEPEPEIFELYECTLAKLEQSYEPEPILRSFEFNLLNKLGFGVTVHQLAHSHTLVDSKKFYIFKPGEGLYLSDFNDGQKDINNNELVFQGKFLLALANEDFSEPETLLCAKVILRQAIQQATMHRPILSRSIFSRRPYDYS